MAMATQSPTATIAATRAGIRILMREGDDYGARSLQRRRRRGGVATAQRNASHGRRRGARCSVLETPRTRAAALRRSSAGALTFSVERDQKCIAKRGVMGGIGYRRRRAAAPLVRRALRATTFPVMPSPRIDFARLVA